MGVGGIFSRGPLVDFSNFFYGGQKWLNFFPRSKLKKTTFLAKIFKIQGRLGPSCPPFRRPCLQHECERPDVERKYMNNGKAQ